jgi:hypothetical protein
MAESSVRQGRAGRVGLLVGPVDDLLCQRDRALVLSGQERRVRRPADDFHPVDRQRYLAGGIPHPERALVMDQGFGEGMDAFGRKTRVDRRAQRLWKPTRSMPVMLCQLSGRGGAGKLRPPAERSATVV